MNISEWEHRLFSQVCYLLDSTSGKKIKDDLQLLSELKSFAEVDKVEQCILCSDDELQTLCIDAIRDYRFYETMEERKEKNDK